jgi:hypothetical protein
MSNLGAGRPASVRPWRPAQRPWPFARPATRLIRSSRSVPPMTRQLSRRTAPRLPAWKIPSCRRAPPRRPACVPRKNSTIPPTLKRPQRRPVRWPSGRHRHRHAGPGVARWCVRRRPQVRGRSTAHRAPAAGLGPGRRRRRWWRSPGSRRWSRPGGGEMASGGRRRCRPEAGAGDRRPPRPSPPPFSVGVEEPGSTLIGRTNGVESRCGAAALGRT